MSTETCKLCEKDGTPWFFINGNICLSCYENSKGDQWINIKDKLPPVHTYVLTFQDEGVHSVKIKWVFSNVVKEMMSSKSRFYKVSHWMPLPSEPEVKDE